MNNDTEPRCAGRAWLFISTREADHKLARRDCLGLDNNNKRDGRGQCPIFDACQASVADFRTTQWQSGLEGTWAGKLYGKRSHKASA